MYACVAATQGRTRCRNWAKAGGLCFFHQKRKEAGETVEPAPKPDTVLFKFNINERWRAKLIKLGVPVKERDVEAEDKRHRLHAEAYRRKADRYKRSVPDSGVPVFGKKGLANVSLLEVFQELMDIYEIVDIHIRPKRDKTPWMAVLVVSFSSGEPSQILEVTQELLRLLTGSSWGHVHIWANPPSLDDGRIIHTINAVHRQEERTAEQILRFAHGLWETEPLG